MSILLEAIDIVLKIYFGFGFAYGFLIGDSLTSVKWLIFSTLLISSPQQVEAAMYPWLVLGF